MVNYSPEIKKIKIRKMRHLGNRTIKVEKDKLIFQILENKKQHIKEYNDAVVAYKEEALKQLTVQTSRAREGSLDIQLDLVTPVNNADNYDKIVEMFQWEVETVVELSQNEFNEYVQDETEFAVAAKFSNTYYSNVL